MALPYPDGLFRNPPVARNDSTHSSIFGGNGTAPSFQEFIKRTPPPDPTKPLPPTPLIPCRASSSSPPRSRTPASRRSSSVYSRTVSKWGDGGYSWNTLDFGDDPLPLISPLRPVVYSASTPQLGKSSSPPDLLQPRTYSPLINTPSPTESAVTTNSSPVRMNPINAPPAVPRSPRAAKKPLQTVSLEQAKAAINKPGAVHLLPEELRAKTLNRSRSHEPIRMASVTIFSGDSPPELPNAPTLVDTQGRHRSLVGPSGCALRYRTEVATEYPFPVVAPSQHPTVEKTSASSASRWHSASPENARQALEAEGPQEQRARRRIRGPRPETDSHNVGGKSTRNTPGQSPTLISQPETKRYGSVASHDTDSDDSVKYRMKLVPQPLNTKPPAKLPGTVGGQSNHAYAPPCTDIYGDSATDDSRRQSNGGSKSSLPFRLSFSTSSSHRRRSTSGSIPISPPTTIFSPAGKPQKPSKSPFRRDNEDKRVSAYYPYVGPRKQEKSNASLTRKGSKTSPLAFDSVGVECKEDVRRRSSASDKSKQPLLERVAKGAAKYADLLTSPSELPERQYQPITAATVAPGSPHLFPSPIQTAPTQTHLGWSNKAKTAFDEARSSIQSPRRLLGQPSTPAIPEFTHIAAPARPLDETRIGLIEPETPRRKGSIFGSMLDGWKDHRAEKRREELKKVIKVVPNSDSGVGNIQRRSSTFGWM